MRYVASCTILLKPNIVDINSMKSGCKKSIIDPSIGMSIDRNMGQWCFRSTDRSK